MKGGKTMKNKKNLAENIIHGIFLILGLVTVACVLLITVYLVISGIPAIRKIGIMKFLFGTKWASTAAEPEYGILPFILTSIYGTAGAIAVGVPIGFMTAVYLAKVAPPKVKAAVGSAVGLLAGIPSVVYGLVGMMVLVPGIRKLFDVPDGASLLCAIIVLCVMILPSIIKVSVTALEAVPKEYEDASLALGATDIETFFRVSVPAAKSGIGRPRRRKGYRRSNGGHDGRRKRAEYAVAFRKRALSHDRSRKRNVIRRRRKPAAAGALLNRACAVLIHHDDKRGAELFP